MQENPKSSVLKELVNFLLKKLNTYKDLSLERWKGLRDEFLKLYCAYGGKKEILLSPYFQIAFVLSIFTHIFSSYVGTQDCTWAWYDLPIGTLPSLIGFSLAAYAIMLTFGSEKFQKIIKGKNEQEAFSLYINISSTLAHFVITQTVSLFFSIICSLCNITNYIISILGIALFLYALLLAVAATLSVFFLSRMYDMHNDDN